MTILAVFISLLIVFGAGQTMSVNATASAVTQKQPCVQFRGGVCIACPYGSHVYQNECYANITGCTAYTYNLGVMGCSACDSSISTYNPTNGNCTLTVSLTQLAQIQQMSVANNYGDLRYAPISVSQARQMSSFNFCDNYMRNGEYGHFISRASEPVISVATYNDTVNVNFKILYDGSGGQLMLCIISVNPLNNSIKLSALVSIGVSQIVSYCAIYSAQLVCTMCQTGYHLQNGQCFFNIPNCISYSGNICLQCSGYAILVENRCATCSELSDTQNIQFYQDWRLYSTYPTPSKGYMNV